MDNPTDLSPVVRRFIEDAGSLTQSIGMGRVLGQMYAYLYFSPEPKNLSDMQEALGISKGSASMTARQLEQWGAVRKVWVKGDRKDYYQADEWIGGIIRRALGDVIGKRIGSYSALMDESEAMLADNPSGNGGSDAKFVRERLKNLRSFQKKVGRAWNNPLVQRLLK